MGFISLYGLHIPIVTITRNTILLVKDMYVILITSFQGLVLIDMVFAFMTNIMIYMMTLCTRIRSFIIQWCLFVVTLQTVLGRIIIISFSSLWAQIYFYISTLLSLWSVSLLRVIFLIQNSLLLLMCFIGNWIYVIMNMYHNMWVSYFTNKTGAYSEENI